MKKKSLQARRRAEAEKRRVMDEAARQLHIQVRHREEEEKALAEKEEAFFNSNLATSLPDSVRHSWQMTNYSVRRAPTMRLHLNLNSAVGRELLREGDTSTRTSST